MHRPTRSLLLVGIALAFVALLVLYICGALFTGYPSTKDFEGNRDAYAAVVDHISKMDIAESEDIFLTCASDWATDTIEPYDGTSGIRHTIAAKRMADGRLVVTLITKEMGHMGSYGYVYCSGKLLAPDEIGPDTWGGLETSIHVAADMEWWVDDSLPNNWWVVSNRLN